MDDRTGRDDAAEIRAWRRAVRQRLLEARTTMPLEEHQAKSAAVVGLLTAEFPWIRTRRVGIYWPYRREISLLVGAEELAGRAASNPVSVPVGERGYHKLFLDTVTQADKGVDFDFLRAARNRGVTPRS